MPHLLPCTHTMLFQRQYNVLNVGTTSYECPNDVVCELGVSVLSVRIITEFGE